MNLQAASASSALRLPSCSAAVLTAGRPASRRDTRRQVVKFGAGQPHTQRREGLPEDPLHHRRRPTPMGTGQCSQHRTGISAALLRDLPAHAAGSGTPSTGVDTLPTAVPVAVGPISKPPAGTRPGHLRTGSSNVCSTA